MKLLIVLWAVLGLCFAKFYPDTHDDYDAERNKDQKHVCWVIDCFLDKVKCDAPHEFFKQYVQDVFDTGCERCSPAWKHIIGVFYDNAPRHCPHSMPHFYKKYDPTNTLRKKLLDTVKGA